MNINIKQNTKPLDKNNNFLIHLVIRQFVHGTLAVLYRIQTSQITAVMAMQRLVKFLERVLWFYKHRDNF
jgi:hypothetical protein